MWADLLMQFFNCHDCFNSMATRHEVFRLQFLAGAGSESHTEMRKPFVPRSRRAHLRRAIFSRERGDRMKVLASGLRSEKLAWRLVMLSLFDAALEPNFIDAMLLPIGEQADAVRTRHDRLKVLLQFIKRQIFVYILVHLVGRLEIESDF